MHPTLLAVFPMLQQISELAMVGRRCVGASVTVMVCKGYPSPIIIPVPDDRQGVMVKSQYFK